ncbi:dihydropteroate synthase [Streptosporangiaceae bacterium NEAU-GS5]|nr:dihydropteroate synthase [Streptosporangiaceae bacterium NEAU-GS5]
MIRTFGARTFDFSRQVAIMAIVNRTPDSFHDRGRTFGLDAAVEAMLRAVDQGADWLDIGGMPFGPDGPLVDAAEEAERVVPVIQKVRTMTDAVISVDTHRAEVAREALAAGADVVNDTNGVRDAGLATAVAEAGAGLVVTHSLVGPRVRHPRPTYEDVTAEVVAFLRDRVAFARAAGVAPEKIIIDPGHDLNKNTLHSLELTRRLGDLADIGYPLLVALSNKDFIGETLDRPQAQRLEGSLAAAVFSILRGARIVRVHDVRETVAAVRMTEAMLGWRDPAYLRHNM